MEYSGFLFIVPHWWKKLLSPKKPKLKRAMSWHCVMPKITAIELLDSLLNKLQNESFHIREFSSAIRKINQHYIERLDTINTLGRQIILKSRVIHEAKVSFSNREKIFYDLLLNNLNTLMLLSHNIGVYINKLLNLKFNNKSRAFLGKDIENLKLKVIEIEEKITQFYNLLEISGTALDLFYCKAINNEISEYQEDEEIVDNDPKISDPNFCRQLNHNIAILLDKFRKTLENLCKLANDLEQELENNSLDDGFIVFLQFTVQVFDQYAQDKKVFMLNVINQLQGCLSNNAEELDKIILVSKYNFYNRTLHQYRKIDSELQNCQQLFRNINDINNNDQQSLQNIQSKALNDQEDYLQPKSCSLDRKYTYQNIFSATYINSI